MKASEARTGLTYWFGYGDRVKIIGPYEGDDEGLKGHVRVRSLCIGNEIVISPDTNLVEVKDKSLMLR